MTTANTTQQLGTIATVGGLWGGSLLTVLRDTPGELAGTKPEAYDLPAGADLTAVIRSAWSVLRAAWADFTAARQLRADQHGTDAYGSDDFTLTRWLRHLFDQLAYHQLDRCPHGLWVDDADPDDPRDRYPITHLWADRLPLHLLPAGVPLDRTTKGVTGADRQSPHSTLQDYLNRTHRHLWGMVTNGLTLRLLRNNSALTRQAYVEFDLAAMFDDDNYPDFAVLWTALHATRFTGDQPADCYAEQWQSYATDTGVRALNELRSGVEDAIAELGQGAIEHPANTALRQRLETGELSSLDLYRQLLYVAYRHVFLFAVEDRGLLHPPDADPDAISVYRNYYATAIWRDKARRHTGGNHPDAWQAHKTVVAALAHPDGLPALALPPLLGDLWNPDSTPDLNQATITNQRYYTALRRLAWVRREGVLHRVDYRNLGAEELGAVYESLLELTPTASASSREFTFAATPGHARKTTGSYYTPTSLIARILDDALEPVITHTVDGKTGQQAAEALLNLTVCDPAMGSAHFLVAAAHRLARHVAAHRTGNPEPDPEAYRDALRDVVGRCIHGVDVNPMAVDLAKMALWLECHVPGKPLTFLDHHLKVGNALLGVGFDPTIVDWHPGGDRPGGIPDAAFKALHGDDKPAANKLKAANKKRRQGQLTLDLTGGHTDPTPQLADDAARLAAMDDHDPQALAAKQHAYRKLGESDALYRERLRCDAWFATWTTPKTGDQAAAHGQPFDVYYDCHHTDTPAATRPGVHTTHTETREHRFFHWHVEFPDVAMRGGFDALIGNPPWERVKIQQREWFAAHGRDDIANAANAAARNRAITALYDSHDPIDRQLANQWDTAQHTAAATSEILRSSGRFPLGGVGDVNLYAVFADHFLHAHNPHGTAGFLCPVGLATGATYAPFFAHVVDNRRLASFWSFWNHDRLFPEVNDRVTFALVTFVGSNQPVDKIGFTGYVWQATQIDDPDRHYTLTQGDIAAINPNTKTAPLFRHARDADITATIHRHANVLINDTLPPDDPHHNPWHVDFMSMFHMANDSGLFYDHATALTLEAEHDGNQLLLPDGSRALPLYEGKLVWFYDHRAGTYEGQTERQARVNWIPATTSDQKADPTYAPKPGYWVNETRVDERLEGRWNSDWLIAARNITSATNERTVVASVLPRSAVPHSMTLLLCKTDAPQVPTLLASLCSLACDYTARSRVENNLLSYITKQLPLGLAPTQPLPWNQHLNDFTTPRVAELTYTSWHLQSWANDIAYPGAPFRWDEQRREILQAEIDAAFFHVYGLERDEADWVLESFESLAGKQRKAAEKGGYGEFRTKRLVLERYDAMSQAARERTDYITPLDPPPADDRMRHPQ